MDHPQVPGTPVMFVCGNDDAAKQTTVALVSELGFETVDAGELGRRPTARTVRSAVDSPRAAPRSRYRFRIRTSQRSRVTVEYIRYRIDESRHDAFVAAYREAAKAPDRFILRIIWTSIDDHLNGFRPSEQFKKFFPPIRPFVDDIEEMQHYEVVEGLDSDRSAASSRTT
jgi:hypothetical protein